MRQIKAGNMEMFIKSNNIFVYSPPGKIKCYINIPLGLISIKIKLIKDKTIVGKSASKYTKYNYLLSL